jgi:hypothetical protein
MGSVVVEAKPARMAIKSTSERIEIFYLALDVNDHERDQLMNELMENYIIDTLESDATSIYPNIDVMSRVTQVFA